MRSESDSHSVTQPASSSKQAVSIRGDHYSITTRVLHYCLLFFLPLVYSTAYIRYWFTTQSDAYNWYLLVLHINIGLLIFGVAIMAFLFRLHRAVFSGERHHKINSRPLIASLVHYSLFALLLFIPISAYLGLGFDIPVLGLVRVPGFFRLDEVFTAPSFPAEELAYFHMDIGADLLLPALVVLHVSAALYYQFWLRQPVFQKLFFREKG